MKKILIGLLFILTFNIYAQEGEDVGWVARFGIAGGISPTWFFPNLDQVNQEIKDAKLKELSTSGMALWGGGGYAYIMFVDNLRLGGIGLGGTTSTSGNVDGYNKEVKYNFGFGGLTVEYTLPFVKYVGVSVGAIIGAGSQSVEIYKTNTNYTWNNIWDKVQQDGIVMTDEGSDEISNSFLLFAPTLNLDVPVNRFIALRVGAGYTFTFNNNWEVNNGRSIGGVPNNFDADNFFIQTGIYFGFFAY